MRLKKQIILENIRLDKLVHGGQCLAVIKPENVDSMYLHYKTIFVWGGLPGEYVDVQVTKKKSSYLEGVVIDVNNPSKDRVEPLEPNSYLSTSPWQILNFELENKSKQAILSETFEREGINGVEWQAFIGGKKQIGYRNKLEIGFWGDETGIHLAQYVRGTHGKQIINSNCLADPVLNTAANDLVIELNKFAEKKGLMASDLKTVILRSSRVGRVTGALFVKKKLDFSSLCLPNSLMGLKIYLSDAKSPVSVITKELYSFGDIKLEDTINGKNIKYDVNSFFQVNLEVFEMTLKCIKNFAKGEKSIDLYSGVGVIGLSVGASLLIESDSANFDMAKLNAVNSDTEVILANAEKALEYINSDHIVIVDPPRAGLHNNITERLLQAKPPMIIYLSCNPSTQTRDFKLLDSKYKIKYAQGFNFFPRTPHIESLIVLELK